MKEQGDGQTKFTLYFPSVLVEDVVNYLENGSRDTIAVGESIDIILIARYDCDTTDEAKIAVWRDEIQTLCTLANVSVEVDAQTTAGQGASSSTGLDKTVEVPCSAVSTYKEELKNKDEEAEETRQWVELELGRMACRQRITLDYAPENCSTCNINVAIWSPQMVNAEVTEGGILEAFHHYAPEVVLQQYGRSLRQVVVGSLNVLTPPEVMCRHANAGGRHLVSVRVNNKYTSALTLSNISLLTNNSMSLQSSPQDHTSDTDSNTNASDEVDNNSSARIIRPNCQMPMVLVPLECQTFVFTMEVKDKPNIPDSNESVSLILVLTWSNEQHRKNIVTHYRIPIARIRRPGLVITAVPDKDVKLNQRFQVHYSITNNLQDFLSLKLIWNPQKALSEAKAKQCADYRRGVQAVLNSVICHQPTVVLGPCKAGSSLVADVPFTLLHPGMYELGQHMKLNLQYSVVNPTPTATPGHQRTGSITSTHSMPSDSRRDVPMTTRSASMCPLSEGHHRRSSITSTKSFTPAHTPPNGSPLHTNTLASSAGSLSNIHRAADRSTPEVTAGQPIHVTPSAGSRCPSVLSSPGTGRPSPLVPGNITPQQVLKRNCQVYVM